MQLCCQSDQCQTSGYHHHLSPWLWAGYTETWGQANPPPPPGKATWHKEKLGGNVKIIIFTTLILLFYLYLKHIGLGYRTWWFVNMWTLWGPTEPPSLNPMYKPGTDKSSGSDDDHVQSCENRKYSAEVFAACPIVACQSLLCYDFFFGSDPCRNHNQNCNIEERSNHVEPQP